MQFETGAIVGSYRIDGVLAQGGMGVVYRARHIELDRLVALKMIRAEWTFDDDFRQRFRREARLAAKLDHPHIVSPHDFGEDQGALYVVMPLIRGHDLRELIVRDGRLEPARAAALVAQVASALDAAHEQGLVHRDVKPQNVLV